MAVLGPVLAKDGHHVFKGALFLSFQFENRAMWHHVQLCTLSTLASKV